MIANTIALSGIGVYQRWISPYKGFRCAHHALLGQGSCSGFGVTCFQTMGFTEAFAATRERLRECSAVYHAWMALPDEERRRRRDEKAELVANAACSGMDICDMASMLPDSCSMAACPAGGCEMGACDIGACDLGGCSL